jgi:CHAT domain-containing protein/tetratricopeptide (TPR) repeat protein
MTNGDKSKAVKMSQESGQKLISKYLNNLLYMYKFNTTYNDSENLAIEAGELIHSLLSNSNDSAASSLLDQLLNRALEANDNIASILIVAQSLPHLIEYGLLLQAYKAIYKVYNIARNIDINLLPRCMLINYWNDVGLVFTYLNLHTQSMKRFEYVAYLIDNAINSQIFNNDEAEIFISKLTRSYSTLYKNIGWFEEAIKILHEEISNYPENPELLYQIAVLYFDINKYSTGLIYLNKAIDLEKNLREKSKYLISRGYVKGLTDDHDSGVQDLINALSQLKEPDQDIMLSIAMVGMSLFPQFQNGRDFVNYCIKILTSELNNKLFIRNNNPQIFYTIIVMLLMRLLEDGRKEDIIKIIDPQLSIYRQHVDDSQWGWELDILLGWKNYLFNDYKNCWNYIKSGWGKFENKILIANNVNLLPFWMKDKEKYQSITATICHDLVNCGLLPCEVLISVYELMNGREIEARFTRKNPPFDGLTDNMLYENMLNLAKEGEIDFKKKEESKEIKHNILEYDVLLKTLFNKCNQLNKHVDFFIFTETTNNITIIKICSENMKPSIVGNLSIQSKEINYLKQQTFAAFNGANPADLSYLEFKLEPWNKFAHTFGKLISPYIHKNAHICFLPGRLLTGMPLHLTLMPNGLTIIENNTVSYAPNISTLLLINSNKQIKMEKTVTLITVNKEHDNDIFKKRSYIASQEIISSFKHGESKWLKENEADHASVCRCLSNSGEVVFICHGARVGIDKGFGICIANAGKLPPSLLITEGTEHEKYLITWEDLQDLESSPEIIVSMACSTGFTDVIHGGVRLGFEQTLFALGSVCIISPLWDVEQESALKWIACFYKNRLKFPEISIEMAFQKACMDIKKEYNNSFFWGPFTLNGSILKEV